MNCKQCQKEFEYLPDDIKLMRELDPVIGGKKYELPLSDSCPDCRARQRLAFRNERSIYQRQCDLCGKDIISMYQPDKQPDGKKYKVYCNDCWWGDSWSHEDYAREFDFSRPFFEQFAELKQSVPRLAIANTNTVDCDYNNYISRCAHCYLSFVTYSSEHIYYSYWMLQGDKDCYNCSHSYDCELCFDCVDCAKCYGGKFLLFSVGCTNCSFSSNLVNCSDCFLCTNLVNKKFQILNQQYSEEEYLVELEKYKLSTYSGWQKAKDILLSDLMPKRIVRDMRQVKCQDSYGDGLVNCFKCYRVFDSINIENARYIDANNVKDAMDIRGGDLEHSYFSVFVGWGQGFYFTNHSLDSSDVYYSDAVMNGKNIFGCSGIKGGQYCIMNKQYEPEEYFSLVDKIIKHMRQTGEWGKFFPYSLSQFGYNETSAIDFWPLEEAAVKNLGGNWSDYQAPKPTASRTIKASALPDDINDLPEDILDVAVECEVRGKLFKYIKQEIEAYKQNGVPLSRRHHDQRYRDRLALRPSRNLYQHQCDKCGKDITTVYGPDRPEIVYCEDCYQKEIY